MKTALSMFLVLFGLTACHTQKNNAPSTATDTSTQVLWVKDMVEPAQANAIGDAIEETLLDAYTLYDQNEVVTYVQEVGLRVAAFTARPHHPTYEFLVLDTQEWINVGLPGGRIFISKGLLKQVDNESELAGLLGSSIAHVTHQHLLGWLQDNQKLHLTQPVVQNNVVWTNAYQKLRVDGFEEPAMNQADRSGISYAMHAGYDPAGLQHLLTRLTSLLEKDASMQQEGMLGYNALVHRSSMGLILLEQAQVHEKDFSKQKDHFHRIQKYL